MVTHIITDNASKFGKCFRAFPTSITFDHSSANYDIGNLNSDESGNSASEHRDENIERIDVSSIICNQDVQEQDNDNSYYLPNHITCVAHSLNLIATTDISKIADETYNLSVYLQKHLTNYRHSGTC
ncbi:Dimer Tnp hAT domain-containing protein [Aphis craccivora]|uniref:Dimer Tnp hAT domain-containing protein n=1 Tax=Aphis craccivora TaxID=307492 RepID=A0A6G0Z3Q3_APHCR|nr:Dimer Tnp hAT domain-containing protein [Aphis craccivora]